jgi:hypothetical protein
LGSHCLCQIEYNRRRWFCGVDYFLVVWEHLGLEVKGHLRVFSRSEAKINSCGREDLIIGGWKADMY